MNRIYSLLFLIAITALLLLSGCGGDSGSNDDGGDSDLINDKVMGEICTSDAECAGSMCIASGSINYCSQLCVTSAECDAVMTGSCCEGISGQAVCVLPEYCSTDGDGSSESRVLVVNPGDTIDFGEVESNTMPTAEITISNEGNASFMLFDAVWTDTVDLSFSLVDYPESTGVQPSEDVTFLIKLEPQEIGSLSNVLTISNDSDNLPALEITVNAEIIAPIGQAEFGTSVPSIDFGTVPLGSLDNRSTISAINLGEGTAKLTLVRAEIVDDTDGVFSVERVDHGVSVTENAPVELIGRQSLAFSVVFEPTAEKSYTANLRFGYKLDGDEIETLVDVPIGGSAIIPELQITPYPIDFQTVESGTEKTLPIVLKNTTADPIVVNFLRIDLFAGDWMSYFEFSEGGDAQRTINPGEEDFLELTIKPDQYEDDYNCQLVVSTDVDGNTNFYAPIYAAVGAPNELPIAKFSLEPHGAQAPDKITVEPETALDLYGHISQDPDGNVDNLKFQWNLSAAPESTTYIVPYEDVADISVYLDVSGTYMLTLVVEDELGAKSAPKSITVTAGSSSNRIQIEMACTGLTGNSDMDLTWRLPGGKNCNENTSPSGACIVPDPAEDGIVTVMGCGSASLCMTETITHTNAPDGVYQIVMTFDEDCPGGGIWPTCDFGWGTEDALCSLNIYLNDEPTPTYQMTNLSFTEPGPTSEITWRMVREDGQWDEPTEM